MALGRGRPIASGRMLEFARLVTVHPALVHFTIGALPIVIVAYAMAAVRRSPAWTFVGDVALTSTAALTLFTFAFGLVSNAMVRWPGGLDTWRWLHLAFGALSTLLLAGLAGFRLFQRRRDHAFHFDQGGRRGCDFAGHQRNR